MARPVQEKDPKSPASRNLTWAIFCAGGGDVRKLNLTHGEAVAMLDSLNEAKAQRDGTYKNTGAKINFKAVFNAAVRAANKAGAAWENEHKEPLDVIVNGQGKVVGTMGDVCGFSNLVFTDRRTAFCRWVVNVLYKDQPHLAALPHLHLGHNYELSTYLSLKEACNRAALAVFEEHGITCLRHQSKVD